MEREEWRYEPGGPTLDQGHVCGREGPCGWPPSASWLTNTVWKTTLTRRATHLQHKHIVVETYNNTIYIEIFFYLLAKFYVQKAFNNIMSLWHKYWLYSW